MMGVKPFGLASVKVMPNPLPAYAPFELLGISWLRGPSMLYNICYITNGETVSRGPSGRIVVEIDPELKRGLYSELARNGFTFKLWLIGQAQEFIKENQKLGMPKGVSSLRPQPSKVALDGN